MRLVGVVLKHRYSVLAVGCLAGLVAAVLGLTTPRSYTARTTFIPQGVERAVGGAAALAGQLGIDLPANNANESPAFYADLLRSREILKGLLPDTFSVRLSEDDSAAVTPMTLFDLLGIEEGNEALRQERAVRWLERHISTGVTASTGVVSVSVTTPRPELSARIGMRLLELVSAFNRGTRQSQAAAERVFIEARAGEAETQLRRAEGALRAFLEANRQFQDSPRLVFEHDRLEREVAMRQALFTTLSQSFENARISEVRNTPVLTVIEPPEEPAFANSRGIVFKTIAGLLIGIMFGVGLASARELMSRRREVGDEDVRELQVLWGETKGDVRRVLGRTRS